LLTAPQIIVFCTSFKVSFMQIDEKRLVEALFTYASIGVLVVGEQGNIVLANPFAEALFGYDKNELNGHPVEKVIPRRFQHKHVQHRKNFTAHMQNRPMGAGLDLYALRKDESEFPVEVSLAHYGNNDGNFVVAFVNNITIRKKAEEEIRRLNDELEDIVDQRTHELKEALNKLELSKEEIARSLIKEKELNELKSRFVSIASHEFRTPLSTIKSSTYLLQKYITTEEQPRREKHIERIISSVNTLTDILNDFLSVGRIEEGKILIKKNEIDLKPFINNLIDEIKDSTKNGQNINYTNGGEGKIIIDTTLLKHIIFNLLSNAIKFSPENSAILIKSEIANGFLIITVKDSGIGIPKSDQIHLFERFFRASNTSNIQGTGLGLHIVARYVQLLNGTIECRSDLGQGTEMKVSFNLASEVTESHFTIRNNI
jgi:PAS domain S-box-containing protein